MDGRWEDVERILSFNGPFAPKFFTPDGLKLRQEKLEKCPVVVIGAGGLGCELLKDLALVGFTDIHVIDMDTIDVSNLNRQFLFRPADVGSSKAIAAANFINKRVPGVKVVGHHGKIQDMPIDFYKQFKVVISGLDSINARRWLNEMVVSLPKKIKNEHGIDTDDWDIDTLVPLIDGGTEGWMGQSRVIYPYFTPCFECLLHLFPSDPLNFQECTVAVTPRQPEHCIAYAMWFSWKDDPERRDVKIDGDDPDHIQWLLEKASARAKEFGIEGVTHKLTQGVVKRIIPAIASTNAIIAASCANEAYKIATNSSSCLDNWMMYNGGDAVYTSTTSYQRNDECLVCGAKGATVELTTTATLQDFLDAIRADTKNFSKLADPSISVPTPSGMQPVYFSTGVLAAFYNSPDHLSKVLADLVPDGGKLFVLSKGSSNHTEVTIRYKK